jgi:hypothetical protein
MESQENYAIQPAVRGEILNIEDYAMSVDGLVKQVKLIQTVMEKVMQENEHYGKIPGTDKPTLLKPGAEKLALTFRLDPDYSIIREVREKEFIAYTIKCNLRHIPTGQRIASGIGSCNSRETKYRYRNDYELTDKPVPKAYWNARNANNSKEMKRILAGHVPRKNEETGKWVLAKANRVENDNPWDLDNTIIKMACKRALVAATLNATAASDIFTQDVEDMPGIVNGKSKATEPEEGPPEKPDKPEEDEAPTSGPGISFKNKVTCPPGGPEAGKETNTQYCHSVCKEHETCQVYQEAIR